MTIQEIAPAAPVEPPAHIVPDVLLVPAPPADLEECPDLIQHLRTCLDTAIAIADRHAEKGGAERLKAEHLLRLADRYDDAAMAARVQVEKWKDQLTFALEQADLETSRGVNPYPTPAIYCGECGTEVQPLTPEEQAALAAGQTLPDARRGCPTCLPTAVVERVEPADTTP